MVTKRYGGKTSLDIDIQTILSKCLREEKIVTQIIRLCAKKMAHNVIFVQNQRADIG